MITELKENQIFVFGSNLNGNHYGGAAKQAHEQFEAEWGIGEGITGRCYAFPTLNNIMEKCTEDELKESIKRLWICCTENYDKQFLLTKVGCGIAGHSEELMKALFKGFPKNLIKPDDW